jgi:hypothetical protein
MPLTNLEVKYPERYQSSPESKTPSPTKRSNRNLIENWLPKGESEELDASQSQFSFGLVDDRPLPALEKLKSQISHKETSRDVSTAIESELEPLTGSNWMNLVDIIDVLGEHIARCLVSKHFALKESAMRKVIECLKSDHIEDNVSIIHE